MKPTAQEFYLQFLFYRTRIDEVLATLEEAHREDLSQNADMFDITRETFSGRLHPNATLRALEAELADQEEDFLLFLASLLEGGIELQLGAQLESTKEFCGVAAEIFGELSAQRFSAPVLAHRITEPRADLLQKRLSLALRLLSNQA